MGDPGPKAWAGAEGRRGGAVAKARTAAPREHGRAAPGARVRWGRRELLALLFLAAPPSLHGAAISLASGAARPLGAGLRPCPGCSAGADAGPAVVSRAPRAEDGARSGGLCAVYAAESQPAMLRLRGGKGNVKAGRSKSVQRSKSPLDRASVKKAEPKKRRLQKPHNLGPADWMKKVKRPELQRREISMKGMAKGRKKLVFHYWTKSKIKKWKESRVAFRTKRRERREMVKGQLEGNNKGEIIHCWARGWKTKFVKWLPSIGEARKLAEEAEKEAAAAAKKQLEEKEAAGDGDNGEEVGEGDEGGEDGGEKTADGGGAVGGGEEEEDFMGGFGGGSDDSGLF